MSYQSTVIENPTQEQYAAGCVRLMGLLAQWEALEMTGEAGDIEDLSTDLAPFPYAGFLLKEWRFEWIEYDEDEEDSETTEVMLCPLSVDEDFELVEAFLARLTEEVIPKVRERAQELEAALEIAVAKASK